MNYKYIILSFFILVFTLKVNAQIEQEKDSVTRTELKSMIAKTFTKFVTGSPNLGNYASLDFNNPSISFGANYVLNENQVFGVSIEGTSQDGLLPVFTNQYFLP